MSETGQPNARRSNRSALRHFIYALTHCWHGLRIGGSRLISPQMRLLLCGALAGGFIISLTMAFNLPSAPPQASESRAATEGLNLPNWIQAFSSIVAIVVAIGLAVNERAISRRDRAHDRALVQADRRNRRRLMRTALKHHFTHCRIDLHHLKEELDQIKIKEDIGSVDLYFSYASIINNILFFMPNELGINLLVNIETSPEIHKKAFELEAQMDAIRRIAEQNKEIYPCTNTDCMAAAIASGDGPSYNDAADMIEISADMTWSMMCVCTEALEEIGKLDQTD